MDRAGRWMQPLARATALIAAFALILQLALIVGQFGANGQGAILALWRFVGYFTILSNLFVCVVATAMGWRPMALLASASVRLAAVTSILLVGITYSLALRHVWTPTGWQRVADHLLHDVTPPLFLLTWLAAGHGRLGIRHLIAALAFPLAYLGFALIRGSIDGWYAYYFLDPGKAGWGGFALAAGGIALTVASGAMLLIALDKWLARRR